LLISSEDEIFDCSKDAATRKNVIGVLAAHLQANFLYFDHGSEQGLVAQGGEEYIIDKGNDGLLAGRIVYTLACSWGADGGWHAKRNGDNAVHCYVENGGLETTALKEFQESFNYGFRLLHERMQTGEPNFQGILELEKKRMTELSDKLMSQGNVMAAAWMNTNRDSLRWYNGEAEPPESKCFWRRLAVKLFGKKRGWKLLK